MGTSNLSDAEFKTLVIRMLKELSEDLKSIKKIQSETKNSGCFFYAEPFLVSLSPALISIPSN